MMVHGRSLVQRRLCLQLRVVRLTSRRGRVQRTREAFMGARVAGRRGEGGVSTRDELGSRCLAIGH